MTQANDSITVTPGAGATVATHLIASKEHQATVIVDESGHLQGSLPTYTWTTPPSAATASKLHADIFNPTGSGKVMKLMGLWIIPKQDVGNATNPGIRMDLFRTSAAGTGGTAYTYRSATVDQAGGTIVPADTTNTALTTALVTARHLPTGGATIDDWMWGRFIMPDDIQASMGFIQQFHSLLPDLPWAQRWVIRENEGLLVRQGTVANAAQLSVMMTFTLE